MTAATALHEKPPQRPRTAPRTLRSDLDALRSRFEAAVAAQPIAATAAAAGIGFVLAAGLARPAIRLLVGTAAQFAARSAAAQLGEAIREIALAYSEPDGRRPANAATDHNIGGSRS